MVVSKNRLLFILFSCCFFILAKAPMAFAQQESSVVFSNLPAWQEGEIIVDSPIEKLTEIMSDCKYYKLLFPIIRSSRKLSSNQCYLEKKILTDLFWMRVRVDKVISQDKKAAYIKVTRMEGNIKYFEATCNLYALDNNTRTRLVLKMRGNLGLPGIPDSLTNSLIKENLYKTLNFIRYDCQ